MASGVDELLSMLYDMIEDGKPVPMHAEQCKIDRDRALDLMDEIKAQFPVELGEAKKLISAREEYIATAKREADAMRAQAQDQVKRLLNETEILQQAREAANGMMKKAQEQSRDLRRAANEYCEDALRSTEEAVSEAYNDLRKAHSDFRKLLGNTGMPAAAQPVSRPSVYDAAADDGFN